MLHEYLPIYQRKELQEATGRIKTVYEKYCNIYAVYVEVGKEVYNRSFQQQIFIDAQLVSTTSQGITVGDRVERKGVTYDIIKIIERYPHSYEKTFLLSEVLT